MAARILDHIELTYREHFAMISFVTEIVILDPRDR
jgi:hypothetical protein